MKRPLGFRQVLGFTILGIALAGCASRTDETVVQADSPPPTVIPVEGADQKLGATGIVFGTVLHPDGTPLTEGVIWIAAVTDGETASPSTLYPGANGTFISPRLRPGKYRLWTQISVGTQLIESAREVDVQAGYRQRTDLDFSQFTLLEGTITYGGDVPPLEKFRADLMPMLKDAQPIQLQIEPGGQFTAYAQPGEYRLGVTCEPFGMCELDGGIVIEKGGEILKRNFAIPTVGAEVLLIVPEDEEFREGTLITDYRTFNGSIPNRVALSTTSHHYEHIVPGVYQVSFVGENGLQGESEPTAIGPDERNQFTIMLDRPKWRTFYGKFKLPPGRHEYKFFTRADTWRDDLLNPEKVGEGALSNSVFSIPGGAIGLDGTRSMWPRVHDKTGEVEFWVSLPTLKDKAYLRGSFNGWGLDSRYVMDLVEEKNFELTVPLQPGRHEYKLYTTDDIWWLDPSNPMQSGTGLSINNLVLVPEPDQQAGIYPSGYPEIDYATGNVTFRASLPTRTGEVYVRGDFNGWALQPEYRMHVVEGE